MSKYNKSMLFLRGGKKKKSADSKSRRQVLVNVLFG